MSFIEESTSESGSEYSSENENFQIEFVVTTSQATDPTYTDSKIVHGCLLQNYESPC